MPLPFKDLLSWFYFFVRYFFVVVVVVVVVVGLGSTQFPSYCIGEGEKSFYFSVLSGRKIER